MARANRRCLAFHRDLHGSIGQVGQFERDGLGFRPPEVLNGIIASRLAAAGHADADVLDVRVEHVLPVRRRVFPALDETPGQLLGGKALGILLVGDVFQHDAVRIARGRDPLPGFLAVGRVAELVCPGHVLGERLGRFAKLGVDLQRTELVLGAKLVGEFDNLLLHLVEVRRLTCLRRVARWALDGLRVSFRPGLTEKRIGNKEEHQQPPAA